MMVLQNLLEVDGCVDRLRLHKIATAIKDGPHFDNTGDFKDLVLNRLS